MLERVADLSGSYKPELGSGSVLERHTIAGDSPVRESVSGFLGKVPEYDGARGTLSESGRTIFQG